MRISSSVRECRGIVASSIHDKTQIEAAALTRVLLRPNLHGMEQDPSDPGIVIEVKP
jgi:hypothetical protein